ncbi:MAG: S8 family serine peptidase [Candidatus Zixiibacteriota bacterium]
MNKSVSAVLAFVIIVFIGLMISASAVERKGGVSDNLSLIPRKAPAKPLVTKVSSQADLARVIVKFHEDSGVRLRGGRFVSLKGQTLGAANGLLRPYLNGRINRLFSKSEEALSKDKFIYELRSGHELADLNLYYSLDITNPGEAEVIVNQLNRLDIVEIAYAEPRPEPAEDIDPPTPDYEAMQTYLLAAPAGVDAVYAKTLPNGDGTGVKIIDIENEWNQSHEDLDKADGAIIGLGDNPYGEHGTAVIGVMIGGDNGYGVTGICPGADIGMVSAYYYGITNAILIAADNLQAGDLMLIEIHSPGPRYDFQVRMDQLGYICVEYWQDKFDALQYAWAKGIVVVEAAGNGAENLDDVIYENRFDTTYRNSHAIIAGAGAPPSGNFGIDRSRLSFSNYGERVNLQGYGYEVFTTGYGTYWNGGGDPDQFYTSTFSGTSSASPIVTGSVACLQSYYKNLYGVPFDADYAREVLSATGSPQQGNTSEHIGPRPDLAAATAVLTAPPSLYTAPIFIDTSLIEGTSADVQLWIHNRSGSYAVDFSAIAADSLAKSGMSIWLDVAPGNGTIPPNDSFSITASLDASVIEDRLEIYKGMININWGISGGSLDSIEYVPVFLTVPCTPETTYSVASSYSSEETQYDWIEIKNIGTLIPSTAYYNNYAAQPLDDGTAGPFTMPFDFPFYSDGMTYNRIYVGVNGAISFTDPDVNISGYYSSFDIPGSPFSTLISPFWNDLLLGTSHGAHGSIYYYFSPGNDTAIVEWYQIGGYNATDDTLTTFQVILSSNGNIKFQYYEVGHTGLNASALIGLSAVGCTATPYLDTGVPTENMVYNSTAVMFRVSPDPVESGDVNGDSYINILDVTALITYLYKGGTAPNPLDAGDPNCSGNINILDVTYLITYLYKGGPAPCYFQP